MKKKTYFSYRHLKAELKCLYLEQRVWVLETLIKLLVVLFFGAIGI